MASPRELSTGVCVCSAVQVCVCALVRAAISLSGFSTGSPLDPAPPVTLCTLLALFHVMTNAHTPARAARPAASHLDPRHTHMNTHTRKAVSWHFYHRSSCRSLLKNSLKTAASGLCVHLHIYVLERACVCESECVSPG